MPKRARDGKPYRSPAEKKARRDAVESMMRVMDKVATGEAVRPAGRYVIPYSAVAGGGRPRSSAGELKGVDTILTIAGPVIATTNTNGDVFTLNLIAPGTGSYNRVGRKVNLRSVRIKGAANYEFSRDGSENAIQAPLRMVLVWDKQPSGAVPTFATIFGSTLQDGTEASTVVDNLRYDNTDRFRVLMDKWIQIDPLNLASVTAGNEIMTYTCMFDEFIPLKGAETLFSGQSTPCTIADISSGGLFLYFRSTSSSANIADWSIQTNSVARLRYTD